MPSYFKKVGYCQPEDPRDGLFQYSFSTDKESFEFWSSQPEVVDNFNTCMTGIHGSRPSWIEWYPVEECILKEDLSEDPSQVLLVDVGGGDTTFRRLGESLKTSQVDWYWKTYLP